MTPTITTPFPRGSASALLRNMREIILLSTRKSEANESSSIAPTPAIQPRTVLTPGQAGVPSYTGQTMMPLTRAEARMHYKALIPTTMPKEGELLADSELVRILTKLPHEGDAHVNDLDRDMSDYMISQIHSLLLHTVGGVYIRSHEREKLLLDVHGSTIPFARNAYDASDRQYLYRLLPLTKLPEVGDYYYYCRRQRPEKKGNAFEYVPSLTHQYKHVKRTLAQINIQVLPSQIQRLPTNSYTHILSGVLVIRWTSQRWRANWESHPIWL
jgi:hypothetical protein